MREELHASEEIDPMTRRRRIAVALLVVALGAGLATVLFPGPPSEAEARSAIRSRIARQSGGLIELVSFEKTSASEGNFFGTEVCTLEYAATIRFKEDCMWEGGSGLAPWNGSFEAIRGGPGSSLEAFNPAYFGKQRGTKGQTRQVKGDITFCKQGLSWVAR